MPDDDLHGRVANLETWKQVIDAWKVTIDKMYAALERAEISRRHLDDERHSGNLKRFDKIEDHLGSQDRNAEKRDKVIETVLANTQAIQLKLAGEDGADGREAEISKKMAEKAALLASKTANRIALVSLVVAVLAILAAIAVHSH